MLVLWNIKAGVWAGAEVYLTRSIIYSSPGIVGALVRVSLRYDVGQNKECTYLNDICAAAMY